MSRLQPVLRFVTGWNTIFQRRRAVQSRIDANEFLKALSCKGCRSPAMYDKIQVLRTLTQEAGNGPDR